MLGLLGFFRGENSDCRQFTVLCSVVGCYNVLKEASVSVFRVQVVFKLRMGTAS
jgi:hypothetical protein